MNKINISKTGKLFENLTDTDMLNRFNFYDDLCTKHKRLEIRVYDLHVFGYYSKVMSDSFEKSELHYKYLMQEVAMLQSAYKNLSYDEFMAKTKNFKKFLKAWDKVLQVCASSVSKLEKEFAKRHNQKTR